MVDKIQVVRMFNEMDDTYDDIKDLWYSWLFSRLHYFIANDVIIPFQPNRVLDIGCGTGFQSLLYGLTGSQVLGIDISDKLLRVAERKAIEYEFKNDFKLFPEYYDFVKEYDDKIYDLLRGRLKYCKPNFEVGDASDLHFEDEMFDHVNMCGSVINFVEDYRKAITESIRVLKKGGTLFIEFDTKWNPDIFWTVIDGLLLGKLEYDIAFKSALKNVLPPFSESIELDYPFGDTDNPVVMKMKLFSNLEIKSFMMNQRCSLLKFRTIHSFTNLIPSTFLDTESPSIRLVNSFNTLRKLEECNFNLPGCSSVMLFRKS